MGNNKYNLGKQSQTLYRMTLTEEHMRRVRGGGGAAAQRCEIKAWRRDDGGDARIVAARACFDDVEVSGVLLGWVVDAVGFDGGALTKLVTACSQGWDMGQRCVKGIFCFLYFFFFFLCVVFGLLMVAWF